MRAHHLPVSLPLLAAALVVAACAGDGPLPPSAAAPSLANGGGGAATTTRFGTCGLTTDVRLVGEITFVVHVTRTGTRRSLAHINSSARGTGSGEDGSRYRFSYDSNVRVVDFDGEPTPDNPPYTAYVVDRFQLGGLAGAPNVNTHWLFTIRVPGQSSPGSAGHPWVSSRPPR